MPEEKKLPDRFARDSIEGIVIGGKATDEVLEGSKKEEPEEGEIEKEPASSPKVPRSPFRR